MRKPAAWTAHSANASAIRDHGDGHPSKGTGSQQQCAIQQHQISKSFLRFVHQSKTGNYK
jgi:hypothetical protein